MHQVALTRGLFPGFSALVAVGLSSLLAGPSVFAQSFFGEPPPPDVPPVESEPAVPQPTPPLFVPVKPGQPALPTPDAALPGSTPTLFVPSDIPPPAIQATGETIDLIPEATPTPIPVATPVSEPPPVVIPPTITTPALTTPSLTTPILSSTPIPEPDYVPQPQATPAAPRKRAAPPPPATAVSQNQINSWVSRATEKRDANLAAQIGWAYYNRNEYSSAGIWFNQALEWNPQSGDAAYGLALCKFREGDVSSAEAIANYRSGSTPKMKTLQGDIYSRRGTEAYEQKEYAESLEYFNKAAASRALSRNEQIIVAWDLYYTKQYEESARLFEKLYRQRPDNASAQGLYASLTKTKNYEKLDEMSSDVGGPLEKVYMTYGARRYFEANLFYAAADSGGAKIYKVLKNLNTPSVSLGFGYRQKSGSEGEGQLQTVIAPAIEAQVFPANKFILSGYLAHLNLQSGSIPNGAQVGMVPEEFTPYSYDMNTTEDDLWDFAVRLEYQDWLSWYVTLGTTPLNGPLQSRFVGNAGLIWRDIHGYVQGEVYSRSIKESITSWVGSVDPYTGNKWGRVTEMGGSLSFFRSIGEDNTIFLKGGYGEIQGTNVADNTHLYGVASLAHLFDVPGYEYVSVGIAVSYEEFGNNQNHFTYGNGGYFSPQSFVQGVIEVQFLTEEGKNWLVAGSAAAGAQSNTQDGSPYFPLDPDGRDFDGQSSSTGVGMVRIQGAYLINPNWLIGGSANYAVTADYNEGGIYIWGRYFFEPRRGLLRTDLLGFDRY